MNSSRALTGDRFVPRHEDELELEVDDPLLVELQAEDYWYEAYNMRTGARGIFPAYYAIEVTKEPEHTAGSVPSPALAPRGPHVSPAPITPGLTGAPDLSLPGRGPEKSEAQPSRVNPGWGGGWGWPSLGLPAAHSTLAFQP